MVIKEVNEVFLEYFKKGMFTENIFRNYIRDRFHISRSTFFEYLSTPYKSQLKELDEKEKKEKEQNPTLFDDDENINGN